MGLKSEKQGALYDFLSMGCSRYAFQTSGLEVFGSGGIRFSGRKAFGTYMSHEELRLELRIWSPVPFSEHMHTVPGGKMTPTSSGG